ncbi:MAG TPA: thioredoxin family protein, partial [Burkholderiales bacterium]|nr:thioredoxin family protein [Burkholderiales bacterium]
MIPDGLLFLAKGCPHCPVVLDALCALMKEGSIGKLQVVNAEIHPEIAAEYGARSVPWWRIGEFEFEGAASLAEIRKWVQLCGKGDGEKTYFFEMLKSGRRSKVEKMIEKRSERSGILVELLAEPEASMALRLGIGAILEKYGRSGLLEPMIPGLGNLAVHGDDLVRADACHFLSLIGGEAAVPYLRRC